MILQNDSVMKNYSKGNCTQTTLLVKIIHYPFYQLKKTTNLPKSAIFFTKTNLTGKVLNLILFFFV